MGNKKQSRCLERAYGDYIYIRNMMETDGAAGLSDLASTPLRYLKQHGKLDKLEDTDGKGNYAVKINVNVSGDNEPWLLMLGNSDSPEAALRNSFSERTVPYALMRVSGGGDPLEKTMGTDEGGSEPAREAAVKAADDFSDYALRVGIPTGQVSEIYHPAFSDARMDVTGVISATPAVNMRKDEFFDDDILLVIEDAEEKQNESGSEAADAGCAKSASYFRKLRRLLSTGEPKRMIKAISPSEDGSFVFRIGAEYAAVFEEAVEAENLKCFAFEEQTAEDAEAETEVTSGVVTYDYAETSAEPVETEEEVPNKDALLVNKNVGDWGEGYISSGSDADIKFTAGMRRIAEDLNTCSSRGLIERFDSTVGSGAVLMPLGGINQLTPIQAMVNKIPVTRGNTDDCSVMAWGGNPFIAMASPYHAAYLSIAESISKLVATGASFNEVYLSLRGSFGSEDEAMAALLGAFEAEMGLGVPVISGSQEIKDEKTLPMVMAFAATMGKASEMASPEFKGSGHKVIMLCPEIEKDEKSAYHNLPTPGSLVSVWRKAYELIANGKAVAAYACGIGGVAEAIMKMSYGNGVGFEFATADMDWAADENTGALTNKEIFGYSYGSIVMEMKTDDPVKSRSVRIRDIGHTTNSHYIAKDEEALSIGELMMLYEGKLESVYPSHADSGVGEIGNLAYSARSWPTPIFKRAAPKVLIPVAPGCIGEADAARAVTAAGGKADLLLIGSADIIAMEKSAERLAEAIENTQVIFLPDGFSGAAVDSAEILGSLFRSDAAREALEMFLNKKDGLMAGIGEGFKALVDLGLVPFGEITDEDGASLSQGPLSAIQSRIVRVRVASNKSPWLRTNRPGEIYSLPVSSTAGKFTAPDELLNRLAVNGQIAAQYVDRDGMASADVRFNPSASAVGIEAVTSPDGRIIGRMGHAERVGKDLYRNVPGEYLSDMFENAVRYFK